MKAQNFIIPSRIIFSHICGLFILFLSLHHVYAKIVGGTAPSTIIKPTTLKVVLVQFKDDVKWNGFIDTSGTWQGFTYIHTKSDFEDLLASLETYTGYNNDAEQIFGSFRDYFWDMSQQTYTPDVIILNPPTFSGYPQWVTLGKNKEYYDSLGFSTGFENFVAHAKDSTANQLFGGNSSEITASTNIKICYIYAGNYSPGIDIATNLNEMAVPERNNQDRTKLEFVDDKIAHIGYFCHEFGHIMGHWGHPDEIVGEWALMQSGHKNGNVHGNCPAPMNPNFLTLTGWADTIRITQYLPDANLIYNTSPDIPNSYFACELFAYRRYILENKQQGNNFDQFLPHVVSQKEGGILIWKTEYNGVGEGSTTIKPADNDGGAGMLNKAKDMFRPDGEYPYNKISDYSEPANLKLSSTMDSHFAIDKYTQNGNTITVDLIPNYWEDEISTNTTWKASKGLYYIGGDITITSSATLTVESGVAIQLNGNCIKVSNGTIDILDRDNLTIDVDIRLLSNAGVLKGQYSTYQDAFADANSTDEVQIYADETWSDTIAIPCNVKFPAGYTLTVSEGTHLSFVPGTRLTINGSLQAIGTSSNQISFTLSGSSGHWDGIYIHDSIMSPDLIHCIIEHADCGVYVRNTIGYFFFYNSHNT